MNRNLAVLVLVCVNILWGSTYGMTKVALLEIPPPLLGAFRWTLATMLLWLIQLWLRIEARPTAEQSESSNPPQPLAKMQGKPPAHRSPIRVADKDKLRLIALGTLGIGIAYVIGYFGINLTTATDASLMIIGEVIFTSLLAFWLTHDPLGRWKVFGMVLGAIGVTVLVVGHISESGGSSSGWWRAVGDLLILVTLALQALYTVLGTDLARKYPPMTVLTYVCTGSLLIWVPVLLWHFFYGLIPVSLSLRAVGGVLYLAVIASVFCNFIWFSISSKIGAGLSAISLFAQPLVGSFIGLFFLGEPFTLSLAIGAVFIFVALYLTTRTGT